MSYGSKNNFSSIEHPELSEPAQEAPVYPTHREMLPTALVSNIRGGDFIAFVRRITDVSCCGPVFNWRQEKEEEYEIIDRFLTYTGPQRDPKQGKTDPESPNHCRDSLAVQDCSWLPSPMPAKDGTAQNHIASSFHLSIKDLLVLLDLL